MGAGDEGGDGAGDEGHLLGLTQVLQPAVIDNNNCHLIIITAVRQ